MLARRIIALSPDKAFAKQLAIALKAAGGTADAHLTLDELGTGELHAALVVIHMDGAMAGAAAALIPRMAGDTRMIAILPRSSVAAVVDLMQGSDRVAGAMVAETSTRRCSRRWRPGCSRATSSASRSTSRGARRSTASWSATTRRSRCASRRSRSSARR